MQRFCQIILLMISLGDFGSFEGRPLPSNYLSDGIIARSDQAAAVVICMQRWNQNNQCIIRTRFRHVEKSAVSIKRMMAARSNRGHLGILKIGRATRIAVTTASTSGAAAHYKLAPALGRKRTTGLAGNMPIAVEANSNVYVYVNGIVNVRHLSWQYIWRLF